MGNHQWTGSFQADADLSVCCTKLKRAYSCNGHAVVGYCLGHLSRPNPEPPRGIARGSAVDCKGRMLCTMPSMEHASPHTTVYNYKKRNIHSTTGTYKAVGIHNAEHIKPFTSSQLICSHRCQFVYKMGRAHSR